MLRKVTVPAAGKSESFPITGNSIIVVEAPAYDSLVDVPLLSFNSPGDQLPALTRSIYGRSEGRFNRVAVTGTEESAGDEIVIFSTTLCLDDYININSLETRLVAAGVSFDVASTNTAQSLDEADLMNDAGQLPTKIYVSAAENSVKFAFNADPEQGTGGLGSVIEVDAVPIAIEGVNFITSFRFISAVLDQHSDLTIHLEY